jgi:hypothetical protein
MGGTDIVQGLIMERLTMLEDMFIRLSYLNKNPRTAAAVGRAGFHRLVSSLNALEEASASPTGDLDAAIEDFISAFREAGLEREMEARKALTGSGKTRGIGPSVKTNPPRELINEMVSQTLKRLPDEEPCKDDE